MNQLSSWVVVALLAAGATQAGAECTIDEASKQLDPVEVGFCESDAVFIGRVDARLETMRAFRPEGSEQTKHFRTEKSTLAVLKSFKGAAPAKVTMSAELYDKQGAFSFEREKEYLVFAKRLPNSDEYAGASAACSVQPTVLLADAASAIKQLEDHKAGRTKIDCKSIRGRK